MPGGSAELIIGKTMIIESSNFSNQLVFDDDDDENKKNTIIIIINDDDAYYDYASDYDDDDNDGIFRYIGSIPSTTFCQYY